MPELPEVETIKLFLAQNIVGLKVRSVEILNPKSFLGDQKLIIGKEIKSVERRAKVLRIQFTDMELLIHLKMSGQLIFGRNEISNKRYANFAGGHPTKDMYLDMPNKSTRVIFHLSDGSNLFFNDQRKFGWVKLRDTGNEIGDKFLDKLGPEPLDKEFSWEVLKNNLLRRKKTPVKVALLDQEIVAGVGNIYACEACFIAGIDPRKKVLDLTDQEFKKVHKAVVEALQYGIKYGGSSKTNFISPEGKKGLFLDYAFVYGREKLPCKNCGTPIKKIKLGGRGTFYCPQCQPFNSAQREVD
jgi:formamidopyrimidine-DNA glycosylase